MQYPIKWYEWVWRELVCFFAGHDWKSSPQRMTKWWGVEEVPYSVCKVTGNHFYEYIAWWSHKCPRCRYKLRVDMGWPWYPWYKNVWWGIKHGCRSIGIIFECVFIDGYENTPMWKKLGAVLPMAVAFGFENFYIYINDRLPWFPLTFTSWVHENLSEWLEGSHDGQAAE